MSDSNPLSLLWDAWRARKLGKTAPANRQRQHLSEMVSFARQNSIFYREFYRGLPEAIADASMLPVTNKKQLMSRFDDWVTDREATIDKARAFVANMELIGKPFLGKYTVATTSGTTGVPGIFISDDRSMAVVAALGTLMMKEWFDAWEIINILQRGWRMANVCATEGHFASVVASAKHPKMVKSFSVQSSIEELVSALNNFQPVIFGGYASTMMLLASEQEAGRLQIEPILVLPIAEGLADSEYDRLASVFNAKVRTSYAATECPFLSYSCAEKWLHINSDWVVVEAVDGDYKPVPPGEQSHTVLISNLANRVQPIIRYDLGDRVIERGEPCSCGNPLPAIRVEGRTADVLNFPTAGGEIVRIPALALEVIQVPGIELAQIVQSSPSILRVRLKTASGSDPEDVWKMVYGTVKESLLQHKLENVQIERAQEPPEQSSGGKYRTVIPQEQ